MNIIRVLLLSEILLFSHWSLAMDPLPNEVTRMVFEHMSLIKRKSVARVCKMWNFLIRTLPKPVLDGGRGSFVEVVSYDKMRWFLDLLDEYEEGVMPAGHNLACLVLTMPQQFKRFYCAIEHYPIFYAIQDYCCLIRNEEFAAAIERSLTLQELVIDDRPIINIERILLVLERNPYIVNLSLSNARIGYNSAKKIAKHLESNSALETLRLKCNRIGNKGAILLAEALAINTKLKELDLSGNKMMKSLGKEALIKVRDNRTSPLKLILN